MARTGSLRVPERSLGTDQTFSPAGQHESGHQPGRSRGRAAVGYALAPWRCRDVLHEDLVAAEQSLGGGCDSRGGFDLLVRAQAQWRGSRGCRHGVLVEQAPSAVAHPDGRWMDGDRRRRCSGRHRCVSPAADSHRLALSAARLTRRSVEMAEPSSRAEPRPLLRGTRSSSRAGSCLAGARW